MARTTATRTPVSELQLATLVDQPPEGPGWVHEQKFDGYRIVAEVDHTGEAPRPAGKAGRVLTPRDIATLVERGKLRLLSRRFKDWTPEFPTVAAAVAALPVERAVLDGEVAAVLPSGITSFQALHDARAAGTLAYFVFDLLALDGEDLTPLPLDERKARLEKLLGRAHGGGEPGVIRYSDHVTGSGAEFFALACKRGLEGIISKRRDQPYRPGRGTTWVKTKCLLRQELVIGGFTDPERSRVGFGALLVGYYDGDELRYAGKVGTGYSHATLRELRAQLGSLERPASPFSPEPPRAWTGASRHWVAPELVAEIAFLEWTADGRLRHPSFQGLRRDKSPRDVVREAPVRGKR
jgi:bifunctional non-homologous end joining protein LigD